MRLQFKGSLEELPFGTEQLLRALDALVPKDMLRPGDDPARHIYQAGARDLVDWLIQRLEADRNPPEVAEDTWYSDDETMRRFIEDPE